jgi:hypothetical protein
VIQAPRCPFCHESVLRGEALTVCRECHAFHHEPCFRESGGCSACLRSWAVAQRGRPRWRRLAGAITVLGGFVVGHLVGMSVSIVTRTSEDGGSRTPTVRIENARKRLHVYF